MKTQIGSTVFPGVVRIGAESRFVVWAVDFAAVECRLLAGALDFAREIRSSDCAGVAVDLSALEAPTTERTNAVVAFVDELQSRGVSVILHGASAAFWTALTMEDAHWRCASCDDLSGAVATLRDYDALRCECTSDRGRRIHQLRMPARALSLAPICLFLTDRLGCSRVDAWSVADLVEEAYLAMGGMLQQAYGVLDDFSASVGVHDGRATITFLDSGPARENEIILPGDGARVDRIHRFRILDRHNALVLEKDVAVAAEAWGRVSS